jgi:hypothetical protein
MSLKREPIGHFLATVPFSFEDTQVYRVYVLPGEFVFVHVGEVYRPARSLTAQFARPFGLLGALIAQPIISGKGKKLQKKIQMRLEQLDAATFQNIVADRKQNFRLPTSEMSDVRLNMPSFWDRMTHELHLDGIVRFLHATEGKMCLCIQSVNDLTTAYDLLPVAIPGNVAINIEWSERKKRFVAKR